MDGPPDNDLCSVCHGNFNVPCQANCSHWFCGNCIILVWEHGSTFQACKCPLCRRPITLLIPTEDDSQIQRHNHPAVAEILQRVETYNRLFGGPTSTNTLFQLLHSGSTTCGCGCGCGMEEGEVGCLVKTKHLIVEWKLCLAKIVAAVRFAAQHEHLYAKWPSVDHIRMQDLPFLLRRLLRELVDPQRSLPFVIRARVYITMILSAVYILSPIDIIPEAVLGIVGLLDDLLIVLICFFHVATLYRSVLYYRYGGSST